MNMYSTCRFCFYSVQESLSITDVVICISVYAFLSPSTLPSQSVVIHVFFTRDNFFFALPIGVNNVVELCLSGQVTSFVSVYVCQLGCV